MNAVACLTCRRLGATCGPCLVGRWQREHPVDRWQLEYRPGDLVEVFQEHQWVVGTVVRILHEYEYPVVHVNSSHHVIVRKSEIRKFEVRKEGND